jgi:small GTP-binding protein
MILAGEPAVGKTSLVSRYVHGKFKKSYKLTVGLDVSSKELEINGKETVMISISDIGGQARFETIRNIFYKGTHLAMLVYDVTRPLTLEKLVNVWSKEVRQFNPTREGEPPVQMLVIGNKIDLKNERMIRREEGEKVAKDIQAIGHIETSAKNNKNVDNAFHKLAKVFLDKVEKL